MMNYLPPSKCFMKKATFEPLTVILFFFFFLSACDGFGQQKQIVKGSIQRIAVHGKSLEGNLSGDAANRNVSVYLPVSYHTSPSRHYPVIYFLHGYTDDDAKYFGLKKHWMVLPPLLDSAFANGAAREMIVVMPDAYTRFQGSMYSASATTGNWEAFITEELVGFIDGYYRTLAQAESRGL